MTARPAGEGPVPVSPDQRPRVAAAMWTAAGDPAPVILERPVLPEGGDWAWVVPGGDRGLARITLDGSRVVFHAYTDVLYLTPGAAREAAAVLAASADLAAARAARDALDAEVGELARVLRGCTPGMAVPADGDYGLAVARGYAEAALRWFREREAAG